MNEQSLNGILGSKGLGGLLENPEIAAKLPKIMEALAPVMAEMKSEKAGAAVPHADNGGEPQEVRAESEQEGTEKDTAVSAALMAHKSSSERRRALFCALEPYLSDSRREAMEYILKVTTLLDIFSEVM